MKLINSYIFGGKMIHRIFLIFFIFTFSLLASKDLGYDHFPTLNQPSVLKEKQDNLIFLCTLPRSGTNFLSGILNFLTEKPIFWSRSPFWKTGTYINRFRISLDWDSVPILGTHDCSYFSNFSQTENKLIKTTRNYKELYFRNNREFNTISYLQFLEIYFKHLNFFDNWNSEKRLLIYYEDLIDNPLQVILDLADFLNSDASKSEELWENFDYYKKTAIDSYNIHPGKPKSSSNNANFHTKNTEKDNLKKMDEIILQKNAYLVKKYLTSYFEND